MSRSYTKAFIARREHIDIYGHVNNAVWVQWMEDMAASHWASVASTQQRDAYGWVVIRHEIDYRGNIKEGQSVEATTFIPDPPSGARFDRRVDFANSAGKVIVSARTTWAMIDRQTGRLMRVPAEVSDPIVALKQADQASTSPTGT